MQFYIPGNLHGLKVNDTTTIAIIRYVNCIHTTLNNKIPVESREFSLQFLPENFCCDISYTAISIRPRVRDQMHEVRRMIATLREIFMSELCSIKSLVYASTIARAFNRVAGNNVHFKYC